MEIITFLIQSGFNSEVILTGDYTGFNRGTKSNYSDWVQIEDAFKRAGIRYENKIKPTRSLRDSLNALNAFLCFLLNRICVSIPISE
jgi:hypothetical protein